MTHTLDRDSELISCQNRDDCSYAFRHALLTCLVSRTPAPNPRRGGRSFGRRSLYTLLKLLSTCQSLCSFAPIPRLAHALNIFQNIATATFLEALRLFPVVPTIPKITTSDAFITLHRVDSSNTPVPTQVFLPAGTSIIWDTFGTNYSKAYWKDPYDFQPRRFIDTPEYTWPRPTLTSFSAGRRACLGKAFATIESSLILSSILQRYEVTPPPDRIQEFKLKDGESEMERRQRLYKVS